VFSESSGRPATIARNAKAITVSEDLWQMASRMSASRKPSSSRWSMENLSGPTFSASRGFTLIELMIAVAVVAILAMIAVPTYTAQMVKGRRSAAEAVLLDIAQRQQQYFLDSRAVPTYTAQMVKGRRSAAEAVLLDIAQRQQQYFLDSRAYAPNVAALGTTTPVNVRAYYTVTTAPGAGLPPTFTATAAPLAGTAQAGDVTLTIDNTGAKTPVGTW